MGTEEGGVALRLFDNYYRAVYVVLGTVAKQALGIKIPPPPPFKFFKKNWGGGGGGF